MCVFSCSRHFTSPALHITASLIFAILIGEKWCFFKFAFSIYLSIWPTASRYLLKASLCLYVHNFSDMSVSRNKDCPPGVYILVKFRIFKSINRNYQMLFSELHVITCQSFYCFVFSSVCNLKNIRPFILLLKVTNIFSVSPLSVAFLHQDLKFFIVVGQISVLFLLSSKFPVLNKKDYCPVTRLYRQSNWF